MDQESSEELTETNRRLESEIKVISFPFVVHYVRL